MLLVYLLQRILNCDDMIVFDICSVDSCLYSARAVSVDNVCFIRSSCLRLHLMSETVIGSCISSAGYPKREVAVYDICSRRS